MVGTQIEKIKSSTNAKVKDGAYIKFDTLQYVVHSDVNLGWESPTTTFIFENGDEIVLEKDYAKYARVQAQLGLVKFNQSTFNQEVKGKASIPLPNSPIFNDTF